MKEAEERLKILPAFVQKQCHPSRSVRQEDWRKMQKRMKDMDSQGRNIK
jgi:hypothetical protein